MKSNLGGTGELSPASLVPWSRVCTCMNARVNTSKQPDVDISLLVIIMTNVPSTHKINQTLHTFAVLDFQIIYKRDH